MVSQSHSCEVAEIRFEVHRQVYDHGHEVGKPGVGNFPQLTLPSQLFPIGLYGANTAS